MATVRKKSDTDMIMNSTIDYYDKNAEKYAKDTLFADISPAIEKFLSYVLPGGHIFDIGCGSCRDSVTFRCRGFDVTPMDASKELCELARKNFGFDVLNNITAKSSA